MAKINKVEVEIFGNTYTIRGDEDPKYIKEVAEYVDKEMRQITERIPNLSTDKVAILVALNIADEFFKMKEFISKKIAFLVKKIDEELKEPG
ncbi:TPA: cell division protein ZapA [bacterium]|nr:cell division protein ZapA [bacterium]